jgi:hypothetical protein
MFSFKTPKTLCLDFKKTKVSYRKFTCQTGKPVMQLGQRAIYAVDRKFLYYAANPIRYPTLRNWIESPNNYFYYTRSVKSQGVPVLLWDRPKFQYIPWSSDTSPFKTMSKYTQELENVLQQDLTMWIPHIRLLIETVFCEDPADDDVDAVSSEG